MPPECADDLAREVLILNLAVLPLGRKQVETVNRNLAARNHDAGNLGNQNLKVLRE